MNYGPWRKRWFKGCPTREHELESLARGASTTARRRQTGALYPVEATGRVFGSEDSLAYAVYDGYCHKSIALAFFQPQFAPYAPIRLRRQDVSRDSQQGCPYQGASKVQAYI